MTDHWLPTKWIDSRDLTKENIEKGHENGVRVYRSSPGSVTLQLRTYGPLDWRRKNKPRTIISTAQLGKDDIECVIAALMLARDKFTLSD